MVEKTYNCVVCGKEITTTSNRGKRFCSNECRNEYIRKQKAEAKAGLDGKAAQFDQKTGSSPDDYAEQQKKSTLEQLREAIPYALEKNKSVNLPINLEEQGSVTIIEPEDACVGIPVGVPEERRLNEHDRAILVYMKGLINGARLWFGEDREPNQIFDKLLNGINAILDEEEIEL